MERTNALAELAERLSRHLDDWRTVTETVSIWNDFLNAQRIVAELAKVECDKYGCPTCFQSIDAVKTCRAIAEEGAEDGK